MKFAGFGSGKNASVISIPLVNHASTLVNEVPCNREVLQLAVSDRVYHSMGCSMRTPE